MHSQKVFLHMIGTIELFQTDVTVEGFLFFMDILVACKEITAIGGIGAIGAVVPLLAGRRDCIGCIIASCLCFGGRCRGRRFQCLLFLNSISKWQKEQWLKQITNSVCEQYDKNSTYLNSLPLVGNDDWFFEFHGVTKSSEWCCGFHFSSTLLLLPLGTVTELLTLLLPTDADAVFCCLFICWKLWLFSMAPGVGNPFCIKAANPKAVVRWSSFLNGLLLSLPAPWS